MKCQPQADWHRNGQGRAHALRELQAVGLHSEKSSQILKHGRVSCGPGRGHCSGFRELQNRSTNFCLVDGSTSYHLDSIYIVNLNFTAAGPFSPALTPKATAVPFSTRTSP